MLPMEPDAHLAGRDLKTGLGWRDRPVPPHQSLTAPASSNAPSTPSQPGADRF